MTRLSAPRKSSLWVFLLLSIAQTLAAHTTIFGPQRYALTAGAPLTTTATVALPAACRTNAVYTLIVTNGGTTEQRVSSAAIRLNGTLVVPESAFNQTVSELRVPVQLLATNTLTVTTKGGQKDGTLTLALERHIDVTEVTFEKTFTSTATVSTFQNTVTTAAPGDAFTIDLANGNATGASGVKYATVTLNNVVVIDKHDFTQQPALIHRTITLQATNDLQVALEGASGSTARVSILRHPVDTTGPQFSLTLPAGNLVATSPFTLTGRLTDPSGVASASVNTSALDVAADGTFSIPVALQPGANTVKLAATDCEGNTTRQDLILNYDAAPPQVSITSPAPGAFLNKTTVQVSGTATDDIHVASVTVNGQPATLTGTNFSATVTFTADTVGAIDGPRTITVVATDWAGKQSTLNLPIVIDTTRPTIFFAPSRAASPEGWTQSPVTVKFLCVDQTSGIASCTDPVVLGNDGAGQTVAATARDRAGNETTKSLSLNLDAQPPTLHLDTGTPLTNNTAILVSGSIADTLSGVRAVTCNGIQASMQANVFQCPVTLLAGKNTIDVRATDKSDNVAAASIDVRLDVSPPTVELTTPQEASTTKDDTITVAGTVADDVAVASVTINGTPATLAAGGFNGTLQLKDGTNTITVVAADTAGNVNTVSRSVTKFSVPHLTITSPHDYSVTKEASVVVSGSIDAAATVVVNGVSAALTGNTYSASVPLAQGRTVITAIATTVSGHMAAANLNIYRDAIPPRVAIYSPGPDAIVTQNALTVTGMVDDIVVGTVNSGQVSLSVNGIPASVSNRAFLATVPLIPGSNTLVVTATDQAQNVTTLTQLVTYNAGVQARLVLVSGANQTSGVGTPLPQPVTVQAVDTLGTPLVGKPITFHIVQNNGLLHSGSQSDRSLTVSSDARGEASVQWTLGAHAGAGNQRLEVSAPGTTGVLAIAASGTIGTAYHVAPDLGQGQFGAVDAPLPRPIVAVVFDQYANRVANVPVTFTVATGDGSFDGQPSITVLSDSDGRAMARPTLGPLPGQDNNEVVASAPGAAFDATFTASGRTVGLPENTTISGVVVDNVNLPIAGASVRIEGMSLMTQTDTQGQFRLQNVPVGYVKLVVDGSTAQRPGTWPSLEFPIYAIAGQDNTIGMPVYLLPIDVTRGLQVDERKGGTLTFPELPGFSLTVTPGSVIFPGGSRAGTVSVTLVHADKMPMPPSAGQQPRIIVTIQPHGAHFDPPARVSYPNLDGLAPGQIVELSSFDHDLGQFVAIGTGTVSDDATTVQSDPGVGIFKGGWEGVLLPPTTGTVAKCDTCSVLIQRFCVANPVREGQKCKDDLKPCTEDVCQHGKCTHLPLQVVIDGQSYTDRDDPQNASPHPLPSDQAIFANDLTGDSVTWRATVLNAVRARVTNYAWSAHGPATIAGPTGPTASTWTIDRVAWKPGLYVIESAVTFDTGCTIHAKYGQDIGIRTDEIFVVGSILDEILPTANVTAETLFKYSCPNALAYIIVGMGGYGGGFNDVSSTGYVPPLLPDRLYVNSFFLHATHDTYPTANLDVDRPASEAFNLSGVFNYRLFGRTQYKYRVRAGAIIPSSMQVIGNEIARPGKTPWPCGTNATGFGFQAQPGPENSQRAFAPDNSSFVFFLKTRAPDLDVVGYVELNNRDLPYVFFRFRFDAQDGHLKSRLSAGPSDNPDASKFGADGESDYSPLPTFFVYRRYWDGSHYRAELLHEMHQDLPRFLNDSPILGSPHFP